MSDRGRGGSDGTRTSAPAAHRTRRCGSLTPSLRRSGYTGRTGNGCRVPPCPRPCSEDPAGRRLNRNVPEGEWPPSIPGYRLAQRRISPCWIGLGCVHPGPSSMRCGMNIHSDRITTFRRLHSSGCFVMPNPWDAGSARALEQMGFKALATTSAGFAWTLGRADNQVTLDQVLEHLRAVAAAVKVPVNADFEGGFAVDPTHVAANVKLAPAPGLAGLSLEASPRDDLHPLFEFDLAVERVRAARRAIDESGTGIVLTGRSEGFVVGRPDIDETIRRLRASPEPGADCPL